MNRLMRWCVPDGTVDDRMSTHSNGEKVKVITRWGDPMTVIPDCHTGRQFTNPIVRQMLRAFGVTLCPDCDRFAGMAPRVERNLRRKGTGWRERP